MTLKYDGKIGREHRFPRQRSRSSVLRQMTRFVALASDYDGTLARDGQVDEPL